MRHVTEGLATLYIRTQRCRHCRGPFYEDRGLPPHDWLHGHVSCLFCGRHALIIDYDGPFQAPLPNASVAPPVGRPRRVA